MVDWDNSEMRARSQRVEILNASNVVIDSQTVTGFNAGKYLVWNLSGHVYIRVTNLNLIGSRSERYLLRTRLHGISAKYAVRKDRYDDTGYIGKASMANKDSRS